MFGLQDQVNSASNLLYYAHSGLQVRQRNVSKQQRSNETTAQQMKDTLSDYVLMLNTGRRLQVFKCSGSRWWAGVGM